MFLSPLFRAPKYKPNTIQYTPRKLEALDHWSLVDEIIRACHRRRRLQGPSPGKWLQTYWGPWWLNLFSKYEVWVLRIRDSWIIKILRTQDQANRILSLYHYDLRLVTIATVRSWLVKLSPSVPLAVIRLQFFWHREPLDIWLGGLPKTFQIPDKIEIRKPKYRVPNSDEFSSSSVPTVCPLSKVLPKCVRFWSVFVRPSS